MDAFLAKRFVERGIIRGHTEFEAYFKVHSLSGDENERQLGTFRITAAKFSQERQQMIFEAQHPDTKRPYRFTNRDVISLDGMSPECIAGVFNLSATGEDMPEPKKKGRKPRVPPAENPS